MELSRSHKQWAGSSYRESHDREPLGRNPRLIKYVYFCSGQPPTINEFDTQSSTIFGHANAVGAEAVGAARYLLTRRPLGFPSDLGVFLFIWGDSDSIRLG